MTPERFRSLRETFGSYRERIEPHSTDHAHCEISAHGVEEGVLDYAVGRAVRYPAAVPEGLEIRRIPAAHDTVVTCPVQAIGETYRHIFGEWLPRSPYRLSTDSPSFEQHPPRDEGSALRADPHARREEAERPAVGGHRRLDGRCSGSALS